MKLARNKLMWGLMTFLSVSIVIYLLLVYLQFNPEYYAFESFKLHPIGLYSHVIASSVALLLGPFQFLPRLRQKKYLKLHRWMGRLYLGVGILIGGISGLYMSLFAHGGLINALGFGTLAILWLATGAMAYVTIRRGDIETHRRWMSRNFALTFAAVTLRLWLPLLAVAFQDFDKGYQMVSWLAWVPNLLIAEWILRRRPTTGSKQLEQAPISL